MCSSSSTLFTRDGQLAIHTQQNCWAQMYRDQPVARNNLRQHCWLNVGTDAVCWGLFAH